MPAKLVDFDTIARVLRASAYKRELARDFESVDRWGWLRARFPDVSFVEPEFSFVGPRTSNRVPIGKLLARPFFKPSDEGTKDFQDVQRWVSYLLNKKQFLATLTSDDYIQNKVDRVNEAMARREEHRRGNHARFCDASDKMVGKYPAGGGVGDFLVFSNDPADIFTKSTGRAWEKESCERVGGQFDDGIYSDIEWCNIVIFLFEEGDDEPVGRVMLRTCEDENHAVSFGIEPVWYTIEGRIEGDESFAGYSKEELDDRIKEIVEDRGFSLEYTTCKTPYTYKGYSDHERKGKTSITYGGGDVVDASTVLSEATVDLNADCPFCGTTIEWELTWSAGNPRRNTEKMLEDAFSEKDEEIVSGFYVHDVYVSEFDRGAFNISANETVDECPGPGCGAHRFERDFKRPLQIRFASMFPSSFKKTKAKKWEAERLPRFYELTEGTKELVVSHDSDVQEFVLDEIEGELYHDLVKAIRARKLGHDLVKFFFGFEKAAGTRPERVAGGKSKRSACPLRKEAIRITPKWDAGDLSDDSEYMNGYAVTVKMDETDVDALARAYAIHRFGEERAGELLSRRAQKNVKNFKRLEKFCK